VTPSSTRPTQGGSRAGGSRGSRRGKGMLTSVLRCTSSMTAPFWLSRPCWCWPSPWKRSPSAALNSTSKWCVPPPVVTYLRVGGPVKCGVVSDSSSRPSERRRRSCPDPEIPAIRPPMVIVACRSGIWMSQSLGDGAASSAPGRSSWIDRSPGSRSISGVVCQISTAIMKGAQRQARSAVTLAG
jgi:hypothetical protein